MVFRSDELRLKAQRWRSEAARSYDARDRDALLKLAVAYEELAEQTEASVAARSGVDPGS